MGKHDFPALLTSSDISVPTPCSSEESKLGWTPACSVQPNVSELFHLLSVNFSGYTLIPVFAHTVKHLQDLQGHSEHTCGIINQNKDRAAGLFSYITTD